MSLVTVGVGDCKVSGASESVLATYALGSCIALAIHDPVATVGGHPANMIPSASAPGFGADELCRCLDDGDGLLMTSLQLRQTVCVKSKS